ncbi:unnamed product [Ostreococcus tauri]|uniref:Unnamed product n=1 Tax=Ostreococcus tauri TaxID=70448 RepID=A0A090M1M2_OSTTA|nr:unnamed product [Ostreococcus tauri]CEF98091.1 unnamed product [Ostreococcus tauri]|eukprot:XP_022839075.1 unnamed product [Ostreococcus tauri]
MQSARTKQLLILGSRRNRTNDLLRELSAHKARESKRCPRLRTSSTFDSSPGGSAHRRGTRKRLKSVRAKVDTGLHRRKIDRAFEDDEPATSSLVESFDKTTEEVLSRALPCASSRTEPSVEPEVEPGASDYEEENNHQLPMRTRIRRKCARDAREALGVLYERPLSPRSVNKFCVALEMIRAQRALIESDLFHENVLHEEFGSEDAEKQDEDSVSDVDIVEEYDAMEQMNEEFGSVFGAVAHESKDLLKREMGGANKVNLQRLERELIDQYPSIRNIFRYYSSMLCAFDENITAAELGSMTLSDWMTFMKDCKLIGSNSRHQLVKSSAELLFIRLNWVTDDRGRKVKNQDMSNSDRTLIMPEFICGIMRLAKQIGERQDTFGLTVSRFIHDVVCPRAKSIDVEEFRVRMRFRSVQKTLQKHSVEIQNTFVKYAAAEAKSGVGAGLETMDLKELMCLCRHLEIVSFNDVDRHLLSPLAVQHAFALSQLQVVGDDAGEIDSKEFVELISRVAERFFDVYFAAVADAEASLRVRRLIPESIALSSTLAPRTHDEITLAIKLRWFLPRLASTSR